MVQAGKNIHLLLNINTADELILQHGPCVSVCNACRLPNVSYFFFLGCTVVFVSVNSFPVAN